ncbi:MAG: aminotransferase class I/II-fold pyridoxal phosphate-dependent enzyme, partial [Dehalococcoidia bacterium]|nr:aminotransferase class I/II-fold pyridoxal phosphate-dependent enzyme [Dehalococcoidia bacterium]
MEPRPEVASLPDFTHGGLQTAEMARLGLDPARILDFSVCCNPFGPPPALRSSFSFSQIHMYPDSECVQFRKILSNRVGVGPENMIAGSGATELLRLVALAFIRTGDVILVPSPTYGEYEMASRIMGGRVYRMLLDDDGQYRIDVRALIEVVRKQRPRVVFLCNPNNPTGWYLGRDDVEAVADACDDTLLVLDEAYAGFTADRWESASMMDRCNVLIVRSMT